MLEQGPPFFVALWLHCAYVDAATAATIGAVYVAHRAIYQLTFACEASPAGALHPASHAPPRLVAADYGTFTVACEFATQPAYLCLYYLAISTAGNPACARRP